jgi:hypothetical protein
MALAPPNYRPQDINAGKLFVETKQELAVTEAELPGVPVLNITGTGVFGVIGMSTTNTIGFRYTPGNLALPLSPLGLLATYAGDEGAFELTGMSGWTIDPGAAIAENQVYTWMAIPDILGFPLEIHITALAADDGTPKAGTLTLGDQIEFDGGVVITRVLGTITLSKTYVP